MSELALGTSIVERQICRALEKLWEGPFSPEIINSVEKGVRALLTSRILILSREDSVWDAGSPKISPLSPLPADDWDDPFHDHLLDYEFKHPRDPHPFVGIDESESEFLKGLIDSELEESALAAIPSWVEREGEAFAYIDAWYQGRPPSECNNRARTMWRYEEDYLAPFSARESLGRHAVGHRGPGRHGAYLVGCHRAGLSFYGASPISRICTDHLFSKWPDHLFKVLDEDYRAVARQLQGPGIGVPLPPLTALVLSRARSRSEIPQTLVDLRDEFEEDRERLWEFLSEMWYAPDVAVQLRMLRTLEMASSSIFGSAFPHRSNALSLALASGRLLTGSPGDALESIWEHRQSAPRVGAISFASRLSADLRDHLLNQTEILSRHFTATELREFGAHV